MKIMSATSLGGLWLLEWAWHIRVANLRCEQGYGNLKSQFSIFDSFRDIRVHIYDFLKFLGGSWALKWAWQTLLGQSIGIDENNKCS